MIISDGGNKKLAYWNGTQDSERTQDPGPIEDQDSMRN